MVEGTLGYTPTTEEKKAIETDVVTELKRRAIAQKIVASEADLVVRDILPETDLGLTSEEWIQSGVAGIYTLVISGRNPENKVWGIYGVKNEHVTAVSGPVKPSAANLSGGHAAIPPVIAIKWGLGAGAAKVKDIWHLQRMYVQNDEVYTDQPVIYNKKELFTIYMLARVNASGADGHLILLGKVAEPKGETIMGAEVA